LIALFVIWSIRWIFDSNRQICRTTAVGPVAAHVRPESPVTLVRNTQLRHTTRGKLKSAQRRSVIIASCWQQAELF
jgi:hypothetical protein